MVHIRLIRALQNLGLSLAEIRSYFDNTASLDEQIDRLVLLRNQLDQYIAQLRLRQSTTDEPEIRQVTLPGFTAFCRDFHDADLEQKTNGLRKTYIDTVKQYQMDVHHKMCIQSAFGSDRDGLCVIPVTPASEGTSILSFPQVAAICIYYRGPYENFPSVHARLLRYAEEHGMTPHGYFRNIYMEGPPTHGANKNAYITQVSLPIKFADI